MPRLLLLLPFIIALAGCSSEDEPPPIYLGHLAPTGERASELNGIALAVEQLNADTEQRPHGRRLTVLHGEVGDAPETYRAQAVRLAAINDVQAVIGGGSRETAAELAHAAETEQVLGMATTGDGVGQSNPYLFSVGTDPAERGKYLAMFTVDELDVTRVAILVDRATPPAARLARAFRSHVENSGGSAIETDMAQETADPMTAERIVGGDPEAVLIAGSMEAMRIWPGRLQQAGLAEDAPLLLGPVEAAIPELFEAPGSLSGAYLATPFVFDAESERIQVFVDEYRKQYHFAPDLPAALAYDAIRVYAQAARQTEEFAPEAVREQFQGGHVFNVLTGELWFTPSREPRRPVFIARLQSGGPERLWTYTPERPAKE